MRATMLTPQAAPAKFTLPHASAAMNARFIHAHWRSQTARAAARVHELENDVKAYAARKSENSLFTAHSPIKPRSATPRSMTGLI